MPSASDSAGRLDEGREPEIDRKLHGIARAVRPHVDDLAGELFQHRPGGSRSSALPPTMAKSLPSRAEGMVPSTGEVDQPRAGGLDRRRKLARRHRLQRAHLDEQLAAHVAGQESILAAKDGSGRRCLR